MSKSKNYDVIVIGGGLAGFTLSSILGKHALSVACIDKVSFNPEKPSQDLRTTAISYGSRQVLEQAGIWDTIEAQACPIKKIDILDGNSPVLLDFTSPEVDDKAFGWIVDNHVLRSALIRAMKICDSVDYIAPAEVKNFEISDGIATILFHDNAPITAHLIIGADGRQSFTREWMGVRTRQWSYNQRAVICTVTHDHDHNNGAVEHFWPSGPFAVLPMTDDEAGRHRSSVVFTEHGPEQNSLMRLDDSAFEEVLNEKFPDRYGVVKMIGRRAAYPLGLVHAANYIDTRIALVADAAHGIHPIAGQGLNLGFRDIQEITSLIIDAHQNGADIGSQDLLQTYQRRRRPDNTAMVAITDGLTRLFSNDILPVRFLRRIGLRAVSKLPPAKRFFMKQAMGNR